MGGGEGRRKAHDIPLCGPDPSGPPTYLRSIHLSAASSLSEEKGHQPRNIRFFHGTHFHAKTTGLSLSGENSYFIIKTAERNPTNI